MSTSPLSAKSATRSCRPLSCSRRPWNKSHASEHPAVLARDGPTAARAPTERRPTVPRPAANLVTVSINHTTCFTSIHVKAVSLLTLIYYNGLVSCTPFCDSHKLGEIERVIIFNTIKTVTISGVNRFKVLCCTNSSLSSQ